MFCFFEHARASTRLIVSCLLACFGAVLCLCVFFWDLVSGFLFRLHPPWTSRASIQSFYSFMFHLKLLSASLTFVHCLVSEWLGALLFHSFMAICFVCFVVVCLSGFGFCPDPGLDNEEGGIQSSQQQNSLLTSQMSTSSSESDTSDSEDESKCHDETTEGLPWNENPAVLDESEKENTAASFWLFFVFPLLCMSLIAYVSLCTNFSLLWAWTFPFLHLCLSLLSLVVLHVSCRVFEAVLQVDELHLFRFAVFHGRLRTNTSKSLLFPLDSL